MSNPFLETGFCHLISQYTRTEDAGGNPAYQLVKNIGQKPSSQTVVAQLYVSGMPC